MLKYASILFSMVVIFVHCDDNQPSSPGSTVASETWRLNDSASIQNYADITLFKLSNGSVSVQGAWYYYFFGSKITCTLLGGSVTATNTSLDIFAQGTASYPPDSTGNPDSSPFNLQISGTFKSGKANGTWEIHFSDTTWEGWIEPGRFIGQLQSGSGVTAQTN